MHAPHRPKSSKSQGSRASDRALPAHTSAQLDELVKAFEPCAATASFFLHAQRNVVLVLHHDTLALERKFEKHADDILLISVDNVSERGAGRYVVSYDAGQTVMVWDMFTGEEIARFASYEQIRVAAWLRDGRIAFGNSQGHVILFDVTTSEHSSARTIFDPVTALAPATDCKTFAIGYLNGSILIATLQPFIILHTLTTNRTPSPITGLAWHGSSSKQTTDMLATQTTDGDLRVWSVPKSPNTDTPRIIRILGGAESPENNKSWFSWSKNGRLVQHCDSITRSWDVRTKKVSHENVPTVADVVAICNYGPTATLFTMSSNKMIQQYDVNPQGTPVMVANQQQIPANAPPTPPGSTPRETPPPYGDSHLAVPLETASSEDETQAMSPLQRIAQEMDQLEQERRDQVTPLSPISSRASLSSASSYGRRNKSRQREHKQSLASKSSEVLTNTTLFSPSSGLRSNHESISIRSTSSMSSGKYQPSSLRQTTLRSPEETRAAFVDLFPFVVARLGEVKFRAPQVDPPVTPNSLRREMLSVVFGWDDDIDALIRDEQSRHKPGSESSILLSKWLGDVSADVLAQSIGSQTMTSSDWMLLALTSQLGSAQKQVGEAFVKKLLESGEVHAAVAILLGMGAYNDGIEVYVSRKKYMEALLLTCLSFPSDWQRQCFLIRKWAEVAGANREHELAVRLYSCTSIESTEVWFSPRAQEEVFAAQSKLEAASREATSPPPNTISGRMTAKNASLKLITSFGDSSGAQPHHAASHGTTPIMDSAISPGGSHAPWKRSGSRGLKDPSSARTATPGGYSRKRDPSVGLSSQPEEPEETPLIERRPTPSRPGSRTSNAEPSTALKPRRIAAPTALSATSPVALNKDGSRRREDSRDRNYNKLQLNMVKTVETDDAPSPHSMGPGGRQHRATSSNAQEAVSLVASRAEDLNSPLLTDGSSKSYKGRNIDKYISSLEEANWQAQQLRARSRSRADSKDGRSQSKSRTRDTSESRSQADVTYIKASKRSPSSPAAMTVDESGKLVDRVRQADENADNTNSPIDAKQRTRRGSASSRTRTTSRAQSATRSRGNSPDADARSARGRSQGRRPLVGQRSPTSPSPMEHPNEEYVSHDIRAPPRSSSLHRSEVSVSAPRGSSPERLTRTRSGSRSIRPAVSEPASANPTRMSGDFAAADFEAHSKRLLSKMRQLTKKELAAKELEERRQSLARRPSAPSIPLPSELTAVRPQLHGRAYTDPVNDFAGTLARSQTADPETSRHATKVTGTSTPSVPIGLPATPRAMRHPRYIGSGEPSPSKEHVPAVPAVPENAQTLAPISYFPQDKKGEVSPPLLPPTAYGEKVSIARSASAPPDQPAPTGVWQRSRQGSLSRPTHSRRGSERDVAMAVDSTVPEEDVIVVDTANNNDPPLVPELQHLAGLPPPPPPPPAPPTVSNSSGIINIAVDNQSSGDGFTPRGATPGEASTAVSPSANRRHRNSNNSESFGSKWRSVRERMRSDSKSRAKSPQEATQTSPYETVLPQFNRTRSPEQVIAGSVGNLSPPIAQVSPPTPGSTAYKHPKELRAGVPYDQLPSGGPRPIMEGNMF